VAGKPGKKIEKLEYMGSVIEKDAE